MKKYICIHKYSTAGLLISVLGYAISQALNLDVCAIINVFFISLESFGIDELFTIWFMIFLIFLIIDRIIFFEKKRVSLRKRRYETSKIYNSMLYASNHILRNFIFQSQAMKMEAEENPTFNKNVIEMLEKSIRESEVLIEKLSSIDFINDANIYNSLLDNKNNF